MGKKKIVYVKPEIGQEEFARHIFSLYSKELGYEIINIQKKFPDCTAIDIKRNKIIQIELEYEAGNFISHDHDKQMKPDEEYLVVCWSDKGSEQVRKKGIRVISLKNLLDIEFAEVPDTIEQQIEKPLYRIIGYNSTFALGKDFSDFESVKIFRTNIKFKENYLPKGSVIILYEKEKLIGEFTVMKYLYIEKAPESEYEKNLYQLLTYPVSINDDPTSNLEQWTKGHIIYTNFRVYDPPVPFAILQRNMSRGGSVNVTFEEYRKIRGKI